MLKITSDGRKISYSQRMMDPSLPYEETGKIYKCCDNVWAVYQESSATRGTQMIFCDMATPKGKAKGKSAAESDIDEFGNVDMESAQLYDDMKARMIQLGIPAEEIAFIHDAKNDKQKAALAEKMNEGSIRVLIGSTGKMGVGLNAQMKAVAIHHLDAPWRPGDIEQRDGRVFRQKNENAEAYKFVYVTKGSFDSRLWDILERKQKFINQVMSGDDVGNEIEDTGEVTLSGAEVKAVASGNPLIAEQVALEKEISKLESLQQAHIAGVNRAKEMIGKDEQRIALLSKRVQDAKTDIKGRKDSYSSEKVFRIQIGGQTYTDKKDAGVALVTEAQAKAKEGAYTAIGKFAGFTLRVVKTSEGISGIVAGAGNYGFKTYPLNTTYGINHLIGVVEGLDSRLTGWENSLTETRRDLEIQKELAGEPFKQAEKLKQERSRYREVMDILNPPVEQNVATEEDVQYQSREYLEDGGNYDNERRSAGGMQRNSPDLDRGADTVQSGEDLGGVPTEDDEVYQLRTEKLTDREVLATAAQEVSMASFTEAEQEALNTFRGRLDKLEKLQQKRLELGRQYKDQQFGVNVDRAAAKETLEKMHAIDAQIKAAGDKVLDVEQKAVLRAVLKKARKVVEQKQKEHDDEVLKRWRDRRNNATAIKKNRAAVEKQAKALMNMLAHPTKDAHVPMVLQKPLEKFLDSINFSSKTQLKDGSETVRDVAYTRALAAVKEAVAGQSSAMAQDSDDGTFFLDVPATFLDEIEKHINTIHKATENLELANNRVYSMNSEELKTLASILTIINKSIRDIDKLHMAGAKARVSELGQSTMQEMNSRKPVKSDTGNKGLWANYTPWYAFRKMGKAAQQIFKGLMQGQAKLAMNVKAAIEFAKGTYTAKEAKEWERQAHTVALDSGEKVQMTTAQIMSFYCLSKRKHAVVHLTGGGIHISTVQTKGKDLKQTSDYLLTEQDIAKINGLLTERQIAVAKALQGYMQRVGGRLINEISMARWDYMAATEENYFPIKTMDTNRDAKGPDGERTNLWALLNKSFTKGLTEGANNALLMESIFDVFADHMSECAEYNAFALPLVDAMKWFNYRERSQLEGTQIKDVGVKRTIRDTLGSAATDYFVNLVIDINSGQKAGRHENLMGKLLSRSKIAAVGWNLRVAIQQGTAILRSLLILDAPSLIRGTARIGTKKLVKEMQQYSGIATWKSLGYHDLNVARSVRAQIKGDTSVLDRFNELGMWLPGKMDEWTWARIWAATKAKVAKDQELTGEDLLRATAELFEEIVYQTQVSDSVLTRTSFMRSRSQAAKEIASYMGEPSISFNILVSAFEDYDQDHSRWTKVKRGMMIGFCGYTLSSVTNALVASLADAWRDDDEYEEYWEKYRQAFLGEKSFFDGNLFSELNPLEKIVIVRDVLSALKGYTVSTSYGDMINGTIGLLESLEKYFKGKGSLTDYGVIYTALQTLSNFVGFGASNMLREVVDIWNNTAGKLHPDKIIHRYEETVQSKIRNAYDTGALTYEEAKQALIDNAQMSADGAYWTIREWEDPDGSYSRYDDLYDAVRNGGDFNAAMEELTSHGYTEKAVLSNLKSQIGKWYKGKDIPEGEKITKQQAINMLRKYLSLDSEEITSTVNKWSCYVVTGIEYDDIKQTYLDGKISQSRAVEMRVRYGGYEQEKAAETVKKWGAEKDTGIAYDDIKEVYADGGLTDREVVSLYRTYGGYSAAEAEEKLADLKVYKKYGYSYSELDDAYMDGKLSRAHFRLALIENGAFDAEADDIIEVYDWMSKHRQYGFTYSEAKAYTAEISNYGGSLEDAGLDPQAFLTYRDLRSACKGVDSDGDGRADTNSVKNEVLAIIDAMPITDDQKDALYHLNGWSKWKLNSAPWHKN